MASRGEFDPMPSRGWKVEIVIAASADGGPEGTVAGYGVGASGEVAPELGVGRNGLATAEGRLVMADALVLATEEQVDAIIDIATLTGACLRALGPEVAGLFANDPALAERVSAAAAASSTPASPT